MVRRHPHRLGDVAEAAPGEPVRETLQQARPALRYPEARPASGAWVHHAFCHPELAIRDPSDLISTQATNET